MTHNAERALNTCSLSMEGLGGEGDDELSLVAAGCVGLFAPSHCEMKAALLLLGAAVMYALTPAPPPADTEETPRRTLARYTNGYESEVLAVSIDQLRVQRSSLAAQAACATAATLPELRAALEQLLADLPEAMRESVLSRALIPSLRVNFNTIKNATSEMGERNTAWFYTARWHTLDTGDGWESCIVASSISIAAADMLAGYEVTTRMEKIGRKKTCSAQIGKICIGAREIDDYQEVTTRVPVFKAHVMTPAETHELFGYMEGMCVAEAKKIAGGNRAGEIAHSPPPPLPAAGDEEMDQ